MADESKENVQELTQEQKEELKKRIDDQMQKLGEVFSQCWESEEFKKAFMEDPKAIFREYEINYDDSKEYRIIDTPEKTMIHVLPYEGIRPAMEKLNEILMKNVSDLGDEDAKQLLLEDWKWQIYQCTEDIIYMPIPLCPENLTPEELEMVNGGCLLLAAFFVFVAEAVGTVTSVAVVVELAIAATVFQAVAAIAGVLAVVLVQTLAAWTNVAATGAIVLQFNTSLGWGGDNPAQQTTPTVDPNKRSRGR